MDDQKTQVDYCTECKKYFDIKLLLRDSRLKRGYKRLCKSCNSIKYKNYMIKNKEKLKKSRKASYDKNIKPNLKNHIQNIIDKDPIRYKARILKNSTIKRCNEKNIKYDEKIININFIYEFLMKNKKCECCSKLFSFDKEFGIKNYDGPSIDRFDPSKGYTLDNISFICWECNNIKKDASIEELQNLINWMIKQQNEKTPT